MSNIQESKGSGSKFKVSDIVVGIICFFIGYAFGLLGAAVILGTYFGCAAILKNNQMSTKIKNLICILAAFVAVCIYLMLLFMIFQ